jgi:hypothetical protein
MFKANDRYLIKTPTGYESFAGIQKKIVPDLYTFTFSDGNYVKCSGRHQFLTNVGFLKAEQITLGFSISGKVIQKIDKEDGNFEVYDPVGVENHSTYFSNDVVSHNTEFIGSSATLISGVKLRSLAFHNPLSSIEGFDIYEEPIKDRLYITTVDCSEGVNLDYSTINVLDVSQTPYKQVAKYRNNKLPLLFFPTVIYSIAKKYNEAYVLIETNNIGQQVVDILHYDLEYENIYKLEHHHIKGQSISGGFKRSASFGLKTTKSVKKIGCANLKTLVENDKLIVNDFDTIAEMNTFVRVRDSYAAEEGNNDDLVMGLVIFAWLTAQTFFKDSTDIDVRKLMLAEQNMLVDEDLAPVGIFDNGLKEEITIDSTNGDVWSEKGYTSSATF